MYRCRTVLAFSVIGLLMAALFVSCYKKDIQFGDNMVESHTRLITVDTVTPVMSTYVLDSFATSGTNTLFAGMYNDAFLGNTTASTYFQFGAPILSADVATLIPSHAMYDSLVVLMKPNGYYYGDTTKPFSIEAYQLAAQPDFTYASKLYNTSSVKLLSKLLGTFSKRISPRKDSVNIKLPYEVGLDFYNKIKTKATQVQDESSFLSYFKGICIQPAGTDGGAVYSFNLADTSVRMRLYYHFTIPYLQAKSIDFNVARTTYQFNRIITNRTGTPLEPTTAKQREFFASAQNPYAFTQSGTGTLLKIKFPSLRDLLQVDDVVRLLDAKLILKPVNSTFDNYVYPLPNMLYMTQTDATNIIGPQLLDTTGDVVQYRSAQIDYLYGVNTAYTFSITGYINAMLNTAGTAENGLFILQEPPTASKQIHRGVFGSRQNPKFQTKLVLTLMTVD
jgi:hypothetical protein